MRRIVHRLQRDQLLASVSVIIVAVITFAFLVMLGSNQREQIETDAMIDALQARVVHVGSVHSIVTTTNVGSQQDALVVERTRQQVEIDLLALEPRLGNAAIFGALASGFRDYLDAVDMLIVAARDGSLPAGDAPEKQLAATTLLRLANAIRDARDHQAAESASAWNLARYGTAGAIVFLVVTVLVITRMTERRLRRALLNEERSRLAHERSRQFTALIANISDTIVVLDTSGLIRYASPAIEQILGTPAERVVGTRAIDILHPDDHAENRRLLRDIVARGADGPAATAVVRVRRTDGAWTWIEAVATNRLDIPGIDGIVINARDITERRRGEEQLRFHALHDPLTRLANRTLLTEHIDKALHRSRRSGSAFAVMFLDLDNFKTINDSWGHRVGDELLIGVADRLRSVLRAGDIAARQGGDEFVLLINDISGVSDATRVADRVHAALTLPFVTSGQEFFTSASIGVFVVDGAIGDSTVDDILRHADIAMYTAKRDGRNRTAVYVPELSDLTTVRTLITAD